MVPCRVLHHVVLIADPPMSGDHSVPASLETNRHGRDRQIDESIQAGDLPVIVPPLATSITGNGSCRDVARDEHVERRKNTITSPSVCAAGWCRISMPSPLRYSTSGFVERLRRKRGDWKRRGTGVGGSFSPALSARERIDPTPPRSRR